MKKILAGAGAATVALSMFAGAALADKGGVPNDNACLGQATSEYAHSGPTSVGEAVRVQAQTGERGRSDDVQGFKAANCPADSSAN